MAGSSERSDQAGDAKGSAAKKVLVPMAASAASAATSYAIKKAPDVYRQKVAPKLEQRGGLEKLAQDLLQRMKDVAGSVTPEALPLGAADGRKRSGQSRSGRPSSASPEKLESNRRDREARRRKRRQSLSR